MVRKDRLRYKILSGILENKSQAWLSPRLSLQESGHQTLHVNSSTLEEFSGRDACTVPDTNARCLGKTIMTLSEATGFSGNSSQNMSDHQRRSWCLSLPINPYVACGQTEL